MTQPPASRPSLPHGSEAIAADLLATVCYPGTPYPWEPGDPESVAHRADLGDGLESDESMEKAIAAGWQQLSTQLDHQWQALDAEALPSPWRERLIRRFQGRLPADLLQTLITTAITATHSGESRLHQLVSCVRATLPGWDPGDLMVLARPLAYALRDGRGPQVLESARSVDWQARSRVEQAKLGLAIAAILLKEIENNPPD